MSTVKVGLEITARKHGSVVSAFGSTQKTVEVLGQTIDKAGKKQAQFGRVIDRSMNRGRAVGEMVKKYYALDTAIGKATRSQIQLNKAMASKEAGIANRRQLRGEMFDTAGHAAVFGAPIIGAVKTYMRQEDAATELKMTMMRADGTYGQFNQVLKQAVDLGKDLPGTTENFIRLGTALKEQGVSDNRIVGGGLRTSANLNVVMGMDEYEGGTFFAKMLESHGLDDKDFDKAADLTQRAKFAFGLKKDDMLNSMSYYGANTNLMGLTGVENYEKLLAIQGIGAQNAIESSKFGTSFRGLLDRFASGPKMIEMATKGMKGEVKDILDKSGVKFDFFDEKRNFKGIDHMVKEMEKLNIIKEKFGGEGVSLVSNALFGQENGDLAKLISQVGVEGYQKNLQLMREQADLNMRIAERTSTLSSALEQLGGVAENTFGVFGGVFKDDIRAFANTAQDFIENTLEPWLQKNKGLVLGTVKFVGSLFALKLGFLGIKYAASMVAAPFKTLWVGFARMNALINTFNLWRLTGGLANVSKGFSVATKGAIAFTKAIVFGDIITGFSMAGKAALGFGKALLLSPVTWIVAAIAVGALLIYKYWKPISAFLGGVFEGIGEYFKPLSPMFESLSEKLRPVINFFKELFSAEQVAEGGARSFGYNVGAVIGAILSDVVTVGAMIIDGWRMIFDVLFNTVGSVWDEIQNAFNGGLSGISALIINWSPIGLFYSAFAAVLSWFGIELPAKFTGFGSMIMNGLLNGIKAGATSVLTYITNIGNQIKTAFAGIMGIKSPSRVFMGYGVNMIEGLNIGLARQAPKAENQIKSLSDRLGINPDSDVGFSVNGGSSGGGNYTINFQPTINAPGGDPARIQEALKLAQREFEQMMKQYLFDQGRRSFS